MSIYKDPNMIRQLMLDNYQYPQNKGLKDDPSYQSVHLYSASCIDDIHLQAKIVDNRIEDIVFDGIGCVIAVSSTSIMSELLKGKDKESALNIIDNYLNMHKELPFDEDIIGEALIYHNVHKQANRIKCATISWNGLKSLLLGENDEER